MDGTITSKRLVLRPFVEDDKKAVIAMLTNGEIKKTYMIPDLPTEEEQNAMFARFLKISRSGERFFLAITLGGKPVGWINEVARDGDSIELGYVVDPEYKGNGFATEALTASIGKMFEKGYKKVIAGAFEENAASKRVMEKSGMTRTGGTETIEYRGTQRNCIMYAIEK